MNDGRKFVAAALFFATQAVVVMALWNWLMPDFFGLQKVSYLQAVSFMVLFKFLFDA